MRFLQFEYQLMTWIFLLSITSFITVQLKIIQVISNDVYMLTAWLAQLNWPRNDSRYNCNWVCRILSSLSLIKISMWRARKTSKSFWVHVAIAIWTLQWSECQAVFQHDFTTFLLHQSNLRSNRIRELHPQLCLLRSADVSGQFNNLVMRKPSLGLLRYSDFRLGLIWHL